ncbi:S-adenosyl-L-methionine-dependent methyltransferase [Halteromyces radiatus]|uniref:S-adenosyl-L-methionine-dependent methyltransferase n=1 Tax=Halteromyces radiatus TaxID=101107 RepID=UPI0022211332|nr:S-adenosyl-L-methionine-dependent methyltransferase [Halteromyces radiatus]KAI8088861.1 S-adenosyl-L-methionine-dependent methyltransferase [Halteromyces radiatus]
MSFDSSKDPADEAIRSTNDDATVSRLSAVRLGYFQDPFVQYFVKRPTKRMPIINRGSYIRNCALDTLVRQFLSLPCSTISNKKQIISLGAGFDTRYFMIKSGGLDTETNTGLKHTLSNYFEVDFPENIVKKARIIKQRKELQDIMTQGNDHLSSEENKEQGIRLERGGAELSSHDYHLIGGDLRQWDQIVERLQVHGFDKNAPTLFISECVFIYLPPESATSILEWISTSLSDCAFALYEQIRPDDNFGKTMIRNLLIRNIELKGIHAFPSLEHQERRFLDLGWNYAKAVDINTIHDNILTSQERTRIAKLEMLDEIEEWKLLSDHYCVAWAYKSKQFKDIFASSFGIEKSLV